jgi:flagellar basal-body rod modification protein FlgD
MSILPIGVMQDNNSIKATSEKGVVDKDEFLMLLVTQLQNQDPLNPMDYNQFTAQMAQFSSLEQLYNVNSNLETLNGYQKGVFNENLSSFIGKNVKVYDNSIDLVEGNANQLNFSLNNSATGIYVSIYNPQGDLVKEITQTGTYSQGENSITWDGMDNNGNVLGNGEFTFEVQAIGNGVTFNGNPTRNFLINSIEFVDGVAKLRSGENTIEINNVIGVGEV